MVVLVEHDRDRPVRPGRTARADAALVGDNSPRAVRTEREPPALTRRGPGARQRMPRVMTRVSRADLLFPLLPLLVFLLLMLVFLVFVLGDLHRRTADAVPARADHLAAHRRRLCFP